MTEDAIRTRRNIPVETWAIVRDAYLGGETAESIGRRLGLSVNSIRKRASRGGWTHAAHARALQRHGGEAQDGPVGPGQARERAVAQASSLLAAGRASEATALLKAVDALEKFVPEDSTFRCDAERRLGRRMTEEEDVAAEIAARQLRWQLNEFIEGHAAKLAMEMLSDKQNACAENAYFVLKWRAENLGPEVAEKDRAHAEWGGWYKRYYDDEGNLKPAKVVFDHMWTMLRTHYRKSAGLTATREGERMFQADRIDVTAEAAMPVATPEEMDARRAEIEALGNSPAADWNWGEEWEEWKAKR